MGATSSIPIKVGEGSYGCVFKPAMTCSDGTSKKGKYITKVTSKEVIADTIEKNDILKSIDSNLQITDLSSCELSEKSINQAMRQCEFFVPNKTIYGLNIPDIGDASLLKIEKIEDRFIEYFERTTINDFIGMIIRLCYDIEYINRNKIFHLDIKEDNILFDLNSEPQFKLIDFDFINKFSFENVELLGILRNNTQLNRSYFTPPELIFTSFLPRIPESAMVEDYVFSLDTTDPNGVIVDKTFGPQHIERAYFFKTTTTWYFLKKHTFSSPTSPSYFERTYDYIEQNESTTRTILEENMDFLRREYAGDTWEKFILGLLESWDAFGYGVAMISFINRVLDMIGQVERGLPEPILKPWNKRKLIDCIEILQSLVSLRLSNRRNLSEIREKLLELIA
jgi:serine/threonine protein kinase